MWIGQLGRDIKLKVLMVRNNRVAQLDHQTSRLPESLPQQHRLQRRIQLGGDVLEQTRLAETDRVLQAPQEVPVGQLDYVQAVLLLQVLHELVALALRVNEQRPPLRVLDNDAVLDGEGVLGQARQLPRADFDRVAKSAHHLECRRERQMSRLFAKSSNV